MPLYFGNKDVNLINSLNTEIIDNIIDTVVNVFKIGLYDTNPDLYGEATDKVYFPAVRLAGLIEHEAEDIEENELCIDIIQNVTFKFHRNTLEHIDLYPEISDIIEYNGRQYEIDSAIENQFLGGQVNLNHSIICTAHLTKDGITKINKIKRVAEESSTTDSFYGD